VTAGGPGVGIERFGIHLPRWTLHRAALAECWTQSTAKGRRSVANWDEDVVTMAVDAALPLFEDRPDAETIDAVLFATSSPVFLERQHASIAAQALRIRPRMTFDVVGSLRAGLDALRLAGDLVSGGTAQRVLVLAADQRLLEPGSRLEQQSGDGAAAAVVGSRPGIFEFLGSGEVVDPAVSVWRRTVDNEVRVGDERFVAQRLLQPWLIEAGRRALTDSETSADAVQGAALSAALPKCAGQAIKAIGIASSAICDDTISDDVGFVGVATPLLELALLLDRSAIGDTLLVGAAGDGASAIVGSVGAAETRCRAAESIRDVLASPRQLPIGMWLKFRGQLAFDEPQPFTSEMLLRREQAAMMELTATKCVACGAVQFPPRRVCLRCQTPDRFNSVDLPRQGTVMTYTVEELFPVAEGRLAMSVIDLGPGVRFYTQFTDAEGDDYAIGTPVSLVLRRLHSGGDNPHYFWKAKPEVGAHR
jgi:3-hydroxy-3-methylglutaryl CoA synthase/uncharacterized OB-fold protein